jgi:hypothetical protein
MLNSILLVAFFVVVILILKQAVQAWRIKKGKTKFCPHCRREIPSDASVCMICHRDV